MPALSCIAGSPEPSPSPLLSAPALNEINQLVVWRVAAKWYPLGLSLGVEPAVLATVKADHPGDGEGSCRDLLRRWLSRGPGTGEQPRVWLSVLTAIRETVGETIAEEVEREAVPSTHTTDSLKVFCDVITSEKHVGHPAMQDFGTETKSRLEQKGEWVGGCGCVDGCGGVMPEVPPLVTSVAVRKSGFGVIGDNLALKHGVHNGSRTASTDLGYRGSSTTITSKATSRRSKVCNASSISHMQSLVTSHQGM